MVTPPWRKSLVPRLVSKLQLMNLLRSLLVRLDAYCWSPASNSRRKFTPKLRESDNARYEPLPNALLKLEYLASARTPIHGSFPNVTPYISLSELFASPVR